MSGPVYALMKSSVCHFMNCKHDGKCEECEFGQIREQAVRDEATIMALRGALVSVNESTRVILNDYNNGKDFSRG